MIFSRSVGELRVGRNSRTTDPLAVRSTRQIVWQLRFKNEAERQEYTYVESVPVFVGSRLLRPLDADLAPAHPRAQVARLQRLRYGLGELRILVDGGQPEGELVGEVVAGAAAAGALDERRGPEVLQARAGGGQRLAAALGPSGSVLHD